MNVIKAQDLKLLECRLPSLPWFVEQFVQHKLADLSPSTLLEYSRDFEIFFRWMVHEGLSRSQSVQEIALSELEALTIGNIDSFKLHLQIRSSNSLTTRERKLASLKSLFHYLSQIAEDEHRYPLLKRNVMAKLRTQRLSSAALTAARLQGKILEDDLEIQEFCSFIERDYIGQIVDNPQALHYYEVNKTRDASIVTLILSSGLRVSEVVNLNLEDLDLTKKIAYVYRKGSEDPDLKQGVYFSESGKEAILRYLHRREALYSPQRSEKAVFLTLPRGENQGKRISKRAIQQMVGKYAKAFGKPMLSVHKLRHSFATSYYIKNDIYKTQRQLGHASTETTQLYAQLTDKTMENAINRL
ncbi:tyrosine recombinase XerS [Paenibacillus antri]|uniref:Tyrosine recombinase XerS n=1 Tax=Paenibacillus antri TaxID=2582848 RepID=A0A5R9GHF2_9BACL|nr:tyrosine recombinase XerS [Paenibacillus antri]TLS52804.1 tyrosine recombinase XerS [Paenibacillus antri]